MPRLPPRFLLPSFRRTFIATTRTPSQLPFKTGPAPPRLPPEEQEEYERLVRSSTGAFSTPRPLEPASTSSDSITKRTPPQINQSPQSSPSLSTSNSAVSDEGGVPPRLVANGEGDELHPDIRQGAKPEFEGDVNPKTGEVGGPKNEPLRWGGDSDWSYNGRVTDF
ncbi:hypothetical protein F5884DRAFT_281530 [Xylogone sp. PMI_703]|nr:hypothetical protein F5884DRAFT_281530 [Xylogone sp. PMI_703]